MQSAGFVLAGGLSRRMGTDKALLRSGGLTMVERVAREVLAAAGSVTLVGPVERYRHLGLPVVEDLHPGLGPLAGLEAALSSTDAEWSVVAACDLPAVTAALLRTLLETGFRHPATDAVLACDPGGRRQPLCAAYRRTALPVISSRIRSGHLKLLETIDLLRIHTLTAEAGLLRNVNSPAEWCARV